MARHPAASAAILILLAAAPTAAQTAAQRTAWTEAYLRAEPTGPKFGQAWLRRADAVRAALAERERELRARLAAGEDPALAVGVPGPPPGRYELSGTFRMAVLPGAYSDVVPSYAPAAYEETYFGTAGAGYSLSEFYSEASGGVFTFDGTVYPWITLDQTRAYYLQGSGANPRGRYQEYMHDILVRAEGAVDWREYDNDGPDGVPDSGDDDGYVDMVSFLHPLADGVCRSDDLAGPVATGFRLRWVGGPFNGQPYATGTLGANGQPLLVDDFILSAGLACDGASIATMNINVHEMGHALGLPDLNDLDRSSYGVGVWDVMGYGLYAQTGRPAQLGAWSRRQLGWTTVETVTGPASFTLGPAVLERRAVRIDVPGTNQFFLVENRQRVLADAGLPGEGLVVWHVDDDILLPAVQQYRGTEDETHPGLAVLQADDRADLADKINAGDAGDPFPGLEGVDSLSDDTAPSLRGYGGLRSGVALAAIRESGQTVTFDVHAGELLADEVQDLAPATLGQIGYEDRLHAVGGVGALTWIATSPPPQGLELLPDGRVRGDPESLGAASFGFRVTDEDGASVEGTANVDVAMPPIAEAQVIESLLGGVGLGPVAARALDLAGNRNGRFDVGDALLYRRGGS